MHAEIITNENRQKFNGLLSAVKKIISILVPIGLGVLLTYIDYIDFGKIFFVLFLVMFVVSFSFKNRDYHIKKKMEWRRFFEVLKKYPKIKYTIFIALLCGFTYSSGVMDMIITLFKIHHFETNLNLGFVDSLCAVLSLLANLFFALKLKEKKFRLWTWISGMSFLVMLVLFLIVPSRTTLILYLLFRYSSVIMLTNLSSQLLENESNHEELKNELKAEYFLSLDFLYAVSRSIGYAFLLIVSLLFGIESISYVLILCALSILLQTVIVQYLFQKN